MKTLEMVGNWELMVVIKINYYYGTVPALKVFLTFTNAYISISSIDKTKTAT
jgi:hypothetical protein